MEKFFESPKIGRMEKFTAFVPCTPLRLRNTAAMSAQGGRPYAILHPSLCDPHIEFPVRKLIRLIVLSDRFSLCPECTSGSRNESCRPFFPEEIPCASGFPPDGEAPAARRRTPLSPDIAGLSPAGAHRGAQTSERVGRIFASRSFSRVHSSARTQSFRNRADQPLFPTNSDIPV